MYAELIERFGRECTRKIAVGEPFSQEEFAAYSTLLAAYELHGPPLLGRFAGSDGCIDTVTGRCGHRPPPAHPVFTRPST